MTRYPWTIAANLVRNSLDYAFGETGESYGHFFGEYGYRRPEDYARDIDALVERYQDRLERVALAPQTVEGRTIEVLRVRAPSLPASAPRVLLTSLLHAREFITGETSMEFLLEVLEGRSEVAARLLARCEIDVIVCVNPDGVAINMERMRGWRERFGPLWRGNANGVDLNRNFGPDHSARHRTYRFKASDEFSGDGPFSEPEAKALRDLCQARGYAAACNLHSYSSVFIYPRFGGPEVDPLVEAVVTALPALQPTEAYRPVRGSRFVKEFPGATTLFKVVRGTEWVHGTFDDFLYDIGTRSLLIEISKPGFLPEHIGEMAMSHLRVFNPPPPHRLSTIDNVMPAIFGFYHGILDGLGMD